MNLTGKQWLAITGAVLSAMVTATALFTSIFGADAAQKIVAALSLASMVVNSVSAALASQNNLVRDVAAMPGVERVVVNAQANQTLAQIAVSNDVGARKVEALPSVESQVTQIAKGE